jgi:hypothetical protein
MIVSQGVTPPSKASPAPPPSTLVGYLSDPLCWTAGDQGIDAALIGETATEIIVAFRGTEPFDSPDRARMVLDWLNDADAPLVPDGAGQMAGNVHQGFLGSLDALWPSIWPAIGARLQASPAKPLYITGHSKGGAIAVLAAYRCQAAGLSPYVCTFEAAKAGDEGFAAGYAAAVPHSTRYEYQDDIVPHLPPDDAFIALLGKVPLLSSKVGALTRGYVAVGDLQFINWQGQIVGDSPALDIQRVSQLAILTLSFGFGKIINDHSIDGGSGCAAAVCPGLWPIAPR